MSNSPLVNYTKISPNSTNPRNAAISKITIHHMAGNLTVEQCGNGFSNKSRQASANYAVDNNGRVGMYVEEKNRSWASANPDNDHRAVTIEVANDVIGGNWHVSDIALSKTIELCADICKRNNIKKLEFTGNKSGNLTMHKYFAATTCPGPYLESKFQYIANEVNKKLNGKTELTTVNDIVWELSQRGIITDTNLWINSLTPESDAYWLARKAANMTVNGNGAELTSVNDIVWELANRKIITEKSRWVDNLSKDANLYWLAYKICLKTKNKA